MQLFRELQRRNVFRVAIGYIVSSWLLVQVADLVLENIGAPDWVMQTIMLVLALGFPVVVFFSWAYEVTPEGIKRESEVDRSQSITHVTSRKLDRAIVAVLVIALAYFAYDKFVLSPERVAELVEGMQQVGIESGKVEPDATAEPDNSIAVLPFVNMSGDPDNEYFSDGLTEELLNSLTRVGGLKVTGRTSSFAFKGKNVDMREIGQALNVANLLEGSVRKAGDRVRITAQLVTAADGYHLWSETFDRKLDDIFAIQREISNQVAEALHITLLGDGDNPTASAPEQERNPEAYQEYLRGMFTWQRAPDLPSALTQAKERFEAALAIDSDYVDAYWGMFLVWERLHRNAHVPFEEALAQMQHYADELRRLAPGSDRELSAAARLAYVEYDFRQAATLLEEAAGRYSANVELLTSYASALSTLAEFGKAIEALDRAQQLDPLSLEVLRMQSAVLYRVGDCRGVERVMARADEILPNMGRFRYNLAMCLFETTGNPTAAIPYAEAEPLDWANETALAILYWANGDEKSAREKFQIMMDRAGTGASYQFAQIYAQWGDTEKALEWLQTAIDVRDPGISWAGSDRLLAPLRVNPRFDEILRDIGFR